MTFYQLFPSSARIKWILRVGDLQSLEHLPSLYPTEARCVRDAVDVRKSQFADARWCAHQALRELGISSPAPIEQGEKGMPMFPAGVTGSITHSAGLRAAVVAPQRTIASLGIDVEPARCFSDSILQHIASDSEQQQVWELQRAGLLYADRIVFSAKEAAFKAWYPIALRYLDFQEVQIDVRMNGTFVAYPLLQDAPVPFIEGKWGVAHGFIMSSAMIPTNMLAS
ncbi:4'-phosphopantetheinyl transferase [Corynebacterium choanae]|uniref:4'-phosphopantetheinyl transferase Npt n=1 Tax=Corynebacterium choanae TaxID=1862358 RepID=A0A3G6JCC6_9CORY|nr:4'-phosphopantetheinyl transferase superfamily protein [Corynebacterium choanae]AZA13814.1 4'-phosphopantetheinyl transferase Npt [Corynebacterium choanae]